MLGDSIKIFRNVSSIGIVYNLLLIIPLLVLVSAYNVILKIWFKAH